MPLADVSNTFLEESAAKVRSKPVPWEAYQRAGLITVEDLGLIKRVDRQPRARIESVLMSDGQTYANLYLMLLKKLVRVDPLQYLLVMASDALTDHPERLALFQGSSKSDPDLPYGPLSRTLETQDEFARLKALQIVTALLSSEPSSLQSQHIRSFLSTITVSLQGSQNARDVGVQCLGSLLPRAEVRKAVWKIDELIQGLIQAANSNVSPQLTYQAVYCLWLLSFDTSIAQAINKKYDIIPAFIKIAKIAVKEKVIRVIIATFRNMVTKAPAENLPAMLVAESLPLVKNLSTRKYSDEEVIDDLDFLRDELARNFESLSTYDEYASELESGRLSWSPVHESETFWKENSSKLNDNDYEKLKILLRIIRTAEDSVVLAVAIHDIGQYIKYSGKGRRAVNDLGGKTRIMELMSHADPDVQFQSLVTVQRLVSHSWMS
ncbi:armadillo-type protein [Cantharellus anzutake]|uniref:armadillo-type protein n=1 Tax=Cantharellus anzutake TaxID=1750568 RepID=UPI001907A576|nr:armadillo-type protein [Cantharellus anzutake]KAF8337633.1 armadillo-type protein [Cantharellus anzutake]